MKESDRIILDSMIDRIVKACADVFGDAARCIILKGSVNNEDFIPGYSDVDIHVYVNDDVLVENSSPKLEYVLRFQEAIGMIEPRKIGAREFQILFLSADRADWGPPIEGTYRILWGAPVPAMCKLTAQAFLDLERGQLRSTRQYRLDLLRRYVDKPNSSLPGLVRMTGTFLKPSLYRLVTVLTSDPETSFQLPLDRALDLACEAIPDLENARRFFKAVRDWPKIEGDIEKARETYACGIKTLEVIERWCESHVT